MKIYIGPYGLSNLDEQLNRGLRELGVETRFTHIRTGKNPYFTNTDRYDLYYTSDKYVNVMLKKMSEFFSSCRKYDVFIFSFCVSFGSGLQLGGYRSSILSYFDLPLLKAMGKKIIFLVLGDDLRSRPLLIEECRRMGFEENAKYIENDWLPDSTDSLEENEGKAKMVNKYADLIFTLKDAAQLVDRPFEHLWLGIDLASIRFNISSRQRPLILHVPSNRAVKGTVYIEDAVTRLTSEGYEFDFVLCQNMVNEEVRELLAESSIVIDQVILPAHGLFAVEAMAGGNVVLGATTPLFNNLPAELPIITSTPSTLYDNLKEILEDRSAWEEIMKKGRRYVEKYHDYRKTSRDMLEKIKSIM